MSNESIKRKVRALLEKTTANGASEAEAISALHKAKELMMAHFISEHELNDPYAAQKCIAESAPLYKTKYRVAYFYPSLCLLFDCKHYYNNTHITFFGYEEDVQLCIYFYHFILKACFVEKDKFVQSREYERLKMRAHAKTLISSFVKGFVISVGRKIHLMYQERSSYVTKSVGLAIIEKGKKVDLQFEAMKLNVHTVGKAPIYANKEAFQNGYHKGQEVAITQGLNEAKVEERRALGSG